MNDENMPLNNSEEGNGKLILTMFLFFPILSLPKIISEIYKGRYYALHFFSLFLGVISYLFAPTGDTYEYYKDYLMYQQLSFSDFCDTLQFDVLHETILYVFANLGIYFGYFRLFIAFISYELLFSVYRIIVSETNLELDNKERFSIFLFFFFVLGFATFLRGIRFNLALSFFLYGYSILYYKRYLSRGFFFLLLTALTHYSLIPIVIPTILFYYIPCKIKRSWFLLILLLLYALSKTLLVSLIEYMKFGVELQKKLDVYTTGYWAEDVLLDHSSKFRYAQILGRLTFYPILLIFIAKVKSYSSYGLYVFLLLLLVLVYDMNTVFNRYSFLSIIVFLIPYIINKERYFVKRHFILLLIVSCFSYTSSIYSFRRELSIGMVDRIFYLPLPGILMSTYDEDWMNTQMYDNGDFDFD